MVREHTTIKMAKRVEELSEANFSSRDLSREEKSKEFLESIIHEWVIKPDPENPSISYRQVVWGESEEHYEGDEPEPIPCICGQAITKGEYYIAANLINGNMIHLGAKCYDTFITQRRTYKDYTKRINRRLRNPTQNKRYFDSMSDYTRAVVEEAIKKEIKTANKARERATDLEVELVCMRQENERLKADVRRYRDIRNNRDSMMNMLGSYNY